MAKDMKRSGMSRGDAKALRDLAIEYGLDAHGPEIHINRAGWAGKHWHVHIGPIDHILVWD